MKKNSLILLLSVFLAATGCSVGVDDLDSLSSGNASTLSVNQAPVELYSAECLTVYNLSYGRFGYAYIYVDVANLAYHKNVEIWYSVDGGAWKSAPCEYQESLANNRERWFTSIQLYSYSGDYPTMNIQFALKYTVNGVTYWDNNQGRDYHMTIRRFLTGGSHPTFILGNSAHIRLLNYSYTTNSLGQAVFKSQIVVKNLAYHKNIIFYYSSDAWNKIGAASYSYQSTTAGGEEIWGTEFILVNAPSPMEFYVSYDVNGQSYLEDNEGRKYTVFLGNQWWHGVR